LIIIGKIPTQKMRKILLLLVVASLIVMAFRNFIRLSDQSTEFDNLESATAPLLAKFPIQNHLAYYSNTYDDGLYFKTQLLFTPKVLTKFGKEDTAIFVYDHSVKDTLFHPKRLNYQVLDSLKSGHFQSYFLIRVR
jgi:hypothetical protein